MLYELLFSPDPRNGLLAIELAKSQNVDIAQGLNLVDMAFKKMRYLFGDSDDWAYKLEKVNSLKTLSLAALALHELPECLVYLQQVEVLEIPTNQISRLPDFLVKMPNLHTLWLNRNAFTDFPLVLTQMPWLQSIYLDENKISQIPTEIAQLQNLKILRIKDNLLTTLPLELSKLPRLSALGIGGNPLDFDQIPPVFFRDYQVHKDVANELLYYRYLAKSSKKDPK